MVDVSKFCLKHVNQGKNVAILPAGGLLACGYLEQDDVLFIHPESVNNLEPLLAIAESESSSDNIADFCASFTGITPEVFLQNEIAIFPFNADEIEVNIKNAFEAIDLLNKLSEKAFNALNIIRFIHCRFHVPETLPFIPGQWKNSNGFMGAIIVTSKTARIIAGRKSGAMMVGGLGLGLEAYEESGYHNHEYMFLLAENNKKVGEVGRNVRKALHILNKAMYANDETLKFITLMALFEYLATGSTYTNFKKVRPKIQVHIAKNKSEYHSLTNRFKQFTSKKDLDGVETGYRTRIIHGGTLIDEMLSSEERKNLFYELFGYVEKVIKDMIEDSYHSFDSLQEKRIVMMENIGIKT